MLSLTLACAEGSEAQAEPDRGARFIYAGMMHDQAHPFSQSTYQVRLEWAAAGLERVLPADIVIIVDVLGLATSAATALEGDGTPSVDPGDSPSAALAATAQRAGGIVLFGALVNAKAVAKAVLAEQRARGARTSIAVVAAGGSGSDGAFRVTVEDQFGAGAIIDALGGIGIDHTSPEAAAAGESFRALRPALRHLLTASGTGRERGAQGRTDEVLAAAQVDALTAVPVLREGVLRAYEA